MSTPTYTSRKNAAEIEILKKMGEAEAHLRAALEAMKAANHLAHEAGRKGLGYGWTGDTGRYAQAIGEMLRSDEGEAGLTVLLSKYLTKAR
jgi:DNA-binding transcriptional regulator PaaX